MSFWRGFIHLPAKADTTHRQRPRVMFKICLMTLMMGLWIFIGCGDENPVGSGDECDRLAERHDKAREEHREALDLWERGQITEETLTEFHIKRRAAIDVFEAAGCCCRAF